MAALPCIPIRPIESTVDSNGSHTVRDMLQGVKHLCIVQWTTLFAALSPTSYAFTVRHAVNLDSCGDYLQGDTLGAKVHPRE